LCIGILSISKHRHCRFTSGIVPEPPPALLLQQDALSSLPAHNEAGGGMPLHLYRLEPAIAIAFCCQLLAGEWVAYLKARSAAAGVVLHLSLTQAEALASELREALHTAKKPLVSVAPCPPSHPLLCQPPELEATPTSLAVHTPVSGRFLAIRAQGSLGQEPFLVEVWGTPEQLLALAMQIEEQSQSLRCYTDGSSNHHAMPLGGPDATVHGKL
jgi:hypothetical protein